MASLSESLAWLDEHINLEARAGNIQGLSLGRMRSLVDVLGDPQKAYPVIHLTGTNGKALLALRTRPSQTAARSRRGAPGSLMGTALLTKIISSPSIGSFVEPSMT